MAAEVVVCLVPHWFPSWPQYPGVVGSASQSLPASYRTGGLSSAVQPQCREPAGIYIRVQSDNEIMHIEGCWFKPLQDGNKLEG